MKKEHDAADSIAKMISEAPVGKPITVEFLGNPNPIAVTLRFAGGWVVKQQLGPGRPLELIRGEDNYLEDVLIEILPYDGLQ